MGTCLLVFEMPRKDLQLQNLFFFSFAYLPGRASVVNILLFEQLTDMSLARLSLIYFAFASSNSCFSCTVSQSLPVLLLFAWCISLHV